MPKVLVTGSAGLIGSEAVKFFAQKDFEVFGIDNNMRQYFFGAEASTDWNRQELQGKFKNYYHHNLDIRNNDQIEDLFKKHKFDLIIHTAAQPSHDWAAKEPFTDFSVNANGTLVLLENCRKYCPEAVFIFTSTNKVYGDTPNVLPLVELETRFEISRDHKFYNGIDESMSLDHCKHSIFGASKVAADVMVQEYGRYFKMKTGVFRGGCLTGPSHSPAKLHGFLAYLVKCIALGQEYTILGYKGKQVRDNIHSYDVVSMFYEFYQNPRGGEVYNMGGSRHSNVSMMEAIEKIEKHLHRKGNIKYIDENRIGDHIWYVSSVAKFQKHYPNWKYKYNLDEIITELCEVGSFRRFTASSLDLKNLNFKDASHLFFPEKVFVASHVTEAFGPVQALKSYLNKRFSNVAFIEHPFAYTSISNSKIESLRGSLLSKQAQTRQVAFELLSYLRDFYLTFYWFLTKYPKAKIFIGVNNLNALAGVVLKKIGFKFKLVYYAVECDPKRFKNSLLNNLYSQIDKLASRQADIVFNSSARAAEFRKKYSDNNTVVSSGVVKNLTGNSADYDKNTLVFAGHLSDKMGLELVINSLPKIIATHPKVRLQIFGVGPYYDQLKNLIKQNNLESNVEIFAHTKPEQYYEYLKKAGIGLALYPVKDNLSHYYNDHHNVYEYLACGLPVIVHGSMYSSSLVVDNSLGHAVEYNQQSFVDAINKIISNADLYENTRQNVANWSGCQDWDESFDSGFMQVFAKELGDLNKL